MFGSDAPPSLLEKQIDRAIRDLDRHEIDSEQYGATLDRLKKLHELQDKPDRVSRDTAVLVAANLLGILIIIHHEHVNVISSHAMGLLQKPKINPKKV